MREHGALLARVAMALLGDQAGVERALEQVAKDAAHGAERDANASATRTFLLGLVRTACAAESPRGPRTTAIAATDDGAPATRRDAEPTVARRALARLRPTEREAVVLHLVGGLDVRGVAVACGIDESTARARITSAVARLTEEER